MKHILFLLLFFVVIGCNNNESYMNDLTKVDFANTDIVHLKEDTLKIKMEITGNIYIKDSILLMYSTRYNNYLLHVLNINNGEKLTSLLPIGKSQSEYLKNTRIYFDSHNISESEWGIWIFDRTKNQFRLINIPQSITNNTTVIDSIVKFNNEKKGLIYGFGKIYYSNNLVYARMQELQNGEEKVCQPVKYYKCIVDNELKVGDEILIYNKGISREEHIHALASRDIFSKNKNKIAMAMEFLPQLNIIDLSSEYVKGFYYKDYTSFETVLQNREHDLWYNISITSNDDYIYVLTTEGFEGEYPIFGNMIYVFDWNGNPISRIKTPSFLRTIIVDKNTLYGQDNDYNCYKYNLN